MSLDGSRHQCWSRSKIWSGRFTCWRSGLLGLLTLSVFERDENITGGGVGEGRSVA